MARLDAGLDLQAGILLLLHAALGVALGLPCTHTQAGAGARAG